MSLYEVKSLDICGRSQLIGRAQRVVGSPRCKRWAQGPENLWSRIRRKAKTGIRESPRQWACHERRWKSAINDNSSIEED